MKIAVDSNDGINIASPFNLFQNFMVFEFNEKSESVNQVKSVIKHDRQKRLKLIKSISNTKNILRELDDCRTIISHNLNRPMLNRLQKAGIEVYITFKNRIEDAVGQYLRDKMIHEFTEGD